MLSYCKRTCGLYLTEIITETSPYSTFPAFTLPLPIGKKVLDVVWMKPGRTVKKIIQHDGSSSSAYVMIEIQW